MGRPNEQLNRYNQMQSFTPENYFAVRSPLLSIVNAYDIMHKIAETDSEESFIAIIKDLFSRRLLREAICNASSDLYTQLLNWQAGGLHDKKREHKLAISLYKYFLRMCTRCTPFGLFAGIATGHFADHSNIVLNGMHSHAFNSRLDMKCMAELVSRISNMPGIRDQLLFYPNNSIYRVNDKYRYVEHVLVNKARQYNISSVDRSAYLDKVLELAITGISLGSLAQQTADNEVTEEDCLAFANELVNAQILVSELEPTVTGEDYFIKLLTKLGRLDGTENVIIALEEIQHSLITEKDLISRFDKVASIIQEIDPSVSKSDLLQTDTFLSAGEVCLKYESVQLLNNEMEELYVLSTSNSNANLENFQNRFSMKYEEREMPLLEVLDTELGIGYASGSNEDKDHAPLINDIKTTGKARIKFNYTRLYEFQLKK